MLDTVQSGATDLQSTYFPLEGVSTKTAIAPDDILLNIRSNVKRYGHFTRLHNLPEFHKVKGKDKHIAIVGGGPSVKHYLDDIRQFRTIFAAGSSHDYLRENNVNLTYAGVCDPDALCVKYLQKLDTETKYLIASGCDPEVFEHLKDQQLIMWHCHSDNYTKESIEPNYQGVGGGCTIGLRAISISLILGYNNVHLFGLDSCMGENEDSHAYNAEDVGEIYNIKVSPNKEYLPLNASTFKCAGYQLAQAYQFIDFYKNHYQYFTPYVYGDTLLAAVVNNIHHNMKTMLNGVKQ